MKTYNVSVFIEIGAVVTIEANSQDEAEQLVHDSMSMYDLEQLAHKVVHRDTQVLEITEVTEGN